MKKRYFNLIFFIIILLISGTGCKKNFFDKQPLDAISDQTFWKTEDDARLGLVGCYFVEMGGGWGGDEFWHMNSMMRLDCAGGNASEYHFWPNAYTDRTLNASNSNTESIWVQAYQKIAACNNFLDHIEGVSMDESKKASWTAEVRTIRAYEYFNLALYFGDIPLADHLISISDA